ncbi:monovalent cation/H(+) antiporter subunit G [Roseomonas elaeocarpi]|uniref:Monovalent cation/H(+) antiporter subunit G n=1 Tax=Roseomonas elaeocarpi TaxID=907779 RepID=A0ABV6JWR6_9PROT
MKALLLPALLLLTVAATWLGALGAARLRTPMERLHAVTFVNIAAGTALLLAALVSDGFSARVLKVALIVVLSWATGAALSHATGRALVRREAGRAAAAEGEAP